MDAAKLHLALLKSFGGEEDRREITREAKF